MMKLGPISFIVEWAATKILRNVTDISWKIDEIGDTLNEAKEDLKKIKSGHYQIKSKSPQEIIEEVERCLLYQEKVEDIKNGR